MNHDVGTTTRRTSPFGSILVPALGPILVFILATGFSAVAPPSAVSLKISPGSGPAGTSVTVAGGGWTPGNGNPPYVIYWETKGGKQLGSFSPDGSGKFSTHVSIPEGAKPGSHNIIACEGTFEFEACATAAFHVITPPSATPPFTRTPTRTATRTFTPSPTPTPTPSPTPTEPPSVCGDLGLGPDAEVLDFDGGYPATSSVVFEFSSVVEPPTTVRPHSGSNGARSEIGMEFGSALQPITMLFTPKGATAVGMFVGLDTAEYVESEVTARLDAYGFVGDTDVMTPLGSASVSFPPAPTDIKHCLVFRAGENEVIARVEVDYTDAAGTSMADPRWIDDVTLLWAESPLPADEAPPTVEITTPDDGAFFAGGSVDVRARIVEDRQLSDVWYTVNGGGRQETGYAPVAGDPTLYLTGFGLAPGALTPYADNAITVWAQDRAGQQGSDTVTIHFAPPTPTPALDIYINTFEITQAIQCMGDPGCGSNNSIPIVTGKPTLIRVYAAANMPASGISGRLCRTGECIDSLNRINVQPSTDPVADFRDDLAETINFMLPPSWVQRGRQQFSIEVNPGLADAPECCSDNNRWDDSFYSVAESKRLDVKMIRIRANGITSTNAARWEAVGYLRYVYPTGNIHIWTRDGDASMTSDYDYTDTSGSGCGDGWDGLLDDLWWHNFWNDDPVDWYRYYGMVDEGVPHAYHGCGYTPGDEAGGIVNTTAVHYTDFAGEIAAQEIGHNHGRRHAPGCGAGRPDRTYPAGTDIYGNAGISTIGAWGVDLRTLTLRPPDSNYDFMGYCNSAGQTWVGPYTYRALLGALRSIALNPSPGAGHLLSLAMGLQAPPEVLVGSVWVTPDTATLTRPFYRDLLPADQTLPPADEGDYAVDLLDGAGTSLRRGFFDFTVLSNDEDANGGPLHIILPWAPGTASIAISRDGRVLLEVPVSSSPPTVRLLNPNGGERWGARGTQRLAWEGSDPDGDPLTYNLQISSDGGETWSTLALFLTDTTYEVRLDELAGTEHGRVRIIASDGVNTASDESDADFSITRKGPQIAILNPDDGAAYASGGEVVLQGEAIDYEDGSVADSAFEWTSDRDGELGRGPTLWALPLSAGRHRINLTVTDNDGNSVSDSVVITIGEAGRPPRTTPLIQGLAIAGLCLIAVAGGGLVVIALRKRRPREAALGSR
jgi:hypothetical protein